MPQTEGDSSTTDAMNPENILLLDEDEAMLASKYRCNMRITNDDDELKMEVKTVTADVNITAAAAEENDEEAARAASPDEGWNYMTATGSSNLAFPYVSFIPVSVPPLLMGSKVSICSACPTSVPHPAT
jgi:hypothetical protein